MKNFFILKIIMVGLNIYLSELAFADTDAEIASLIKSGKLILFTNEECPSCRRMEELLKAKQSSDHVEVEYKGKKYVLPIQRVDPWNPKNLAQAEALGYDGGVPQFSIQSNSKIYRSGNKSGSGFFWPNFQEFADNNIDLKQLKVKGSESVSEYNKRIEKYSAKKSKESFSGSINGLVLKTLGVEVQRPENLNGLNSEFSPSLSDKNVLIVGTADLPSTNPIYSGKTVDNIRKVIANNKGIKPTILYGSGKEETPDTAVAFQRMSDGENQPETFLKYSREMADAEPSKVNIVNYLKELSHQPAGTRNLTVLVGHGGPDGFPTWNDPLSQNVIKPDDIGTWTKNDKISNVLISGNCYGGIMADKFSCAFMAANPYVTASGCWSEASQSQGDMPDFVNLFFKSVNDPTADLNKDGATSFAEAQVYAVEKGTEIDSPYTTMDSLADKYFDLSRSEDKLPETINVEQLSKLLNEYGTPAEKILFEKLKAHIGSKNIYNSSNAKFPAVVDTDLNANHKIFIGYPVADYYQLLPAAGAQNEIFVKQFEKNISMGPFTAKYKFDYHKGKVKILDVKAKDDSGSKEQGDTEKSKYFAIPSGGRGAKQVSIYRENKGDLYQKNIYGNHVLMPKFLNTKIGESVVFAQGALTGKVSGVPLNNGTKIVDLKIKDMKKWKKLLVQLNLPDDTQLESIEISINNPEATSSSAQTLLKFSSKTYDDLNVVKGGKPIYRDVYPAKNEVDNLALRTLARRLIFKSKAAKNSEYKDKIKQVEKCEAQNIKDFISVVDSTHATISKDGNNNQQ